VYYN